MQEVLVIAPSVSVANYMAELLKRITKENVSVVHYDYEKGSTKKELKILEIQIGNGLFL